MLLSSFSFHTLWPWRNFVMMFLAKKSTRKNITVTIGCWGECNLSYISTTYKLNVVLFSFSLSTESNTAASNLLCFDLNSTSTPAQSTTLQRTCLISSECGSWVKFLLTLIYFYLIPHVNHDNELSISFLTSCVGQIVLIWRRPSGGKSCCQFVGVVVND